MTPSPAATRLVRAIAIVLFVANALVLVASS